MQFNFQAGLTMCKKLVLIVAIFCGLAACGGGGSLSTSATSGGTGTGSSSTGGGGTTTPVYTIGTGSGAAFQPGAIGIGTTVALAPGGSTSLQVSIVDQTGALYTTSTAVTFSSTCIANGQAVITSGSPATPGNTTTTTTGIVSATYAAKGCSGADVITASAAVASANLSATGTITVTQAGIGSIAFVSASPTSIGLKGTGIGQTSTLVFRVIDSSGGGRPGATVSFALDTTAGGLSISPTTAVSGNDGSVQTVVSSGTSHTAVRVTATVPATATSPAQSTQSSALTVTTGIAASNSFSAAVLCPNVEAYNIDGVVVPVTIHLADRFNNPVPDSTAIAFSGSAGGQIIGSCSTVNGACSVNWTSGGIRSQPPQSLLPGRVMILATALGEESFTDTNGNGFYDTGETFVDLGEPYRDDNESGAYNSGEYFLDFNTSQTRDPPNGSFKGIVCNGNLASSTCNTTTLAIGAQTTIVMSTSGARIILNGVSSATLNAGPPISVTAARNANVGFSYTVQDLNGNPMPNGTSIAVTASAAIGQIDSATNSYVVPCTTAAGGSQYSTFLTAAAAAGSGAVIIKVTSPGGLISLFSIPVTVP